MRLFLEMVPAVFFKNQICQFIVILGLYLASLERCLCEDIDLPRLARETRPAVALLVVYDSAGKEIATATGFFISPGGQLTTNWHVVKDAHSMVAKVEQGQTYQIKGILASSPKEDLAVLQVESGTYPALSLGSSSAVEVGSRVAVIGSPLGLEGSLSDGIVSAKRKLGGEDAWIQITAPISPGSSGSPVLNAKGEVIGVASMNLRGSQALNFAAPIDALKRILHDVSSMTLKSFADARSDASIEFYDDEGVKAVMGAIQAGNFVDALEKIRPIVKAHPERAEAWHLQGSILADLQFWKDALSSLQKANELNPEIAQNWLNLGTCYDELGEPDKAIESYQQAIKLKPKYVMAWRLMGNCYKKRSEWKLAETALNQAINIDPSDAESLIHLSYIYLVQDRAKDAVNILKKAAQLQPNEVAIWNNLTIAYAKDQDWAEMKATVEKTT